MVQKAWKLLRVTVWLSFSSHEISASSSVPLTLAKYAILHPSTSQYAQGSLTSSVPLSICSSRLSTSVSMISTYFASLPFLSTKSNNSASDSSSKSVTSCNVERSIDAACRLCPPQPDRQINRKNITTTQHFFRYFICSAPFIACAQSSAKSRRHHTTAAVLLQSTAKTVEAHKKTSAVSADVHKKCLDFSGHVW